MIKDGYQRVKISKLLNYEMELSFFQLGNRAGLSLSQLLACGLLRGHCEWRCRADDRNLSIGWDWHQTPTAEVLLIEDDFIYTNILVVADSGEELTPDDSEQVIRSWVKTWNWQQSLFRALGVAANTGESAKKGSLPKKTL